MGKCMTANELANKLVDWYEDYNGRFDLIDETIAMLRQQQAEIEALKAEKIRAYDNGYEDGRKPNTNKAQEK